MFSPTASDTLEAPDVLLARAFGEALKACGVSAAQIETAVRAASAKHDLIWLGDTGPHAIQNYARALVEATGDAQLGLKVAAAMPAGATGVYEYILLTAPTLRAVHQLHVQYAPLTSDYMSFVLHDEDGLSCVALNPPRGLRVAPMLEDYRLARTVLGMRRALVDAAFQPVRVDFTYPAPSSPKVHQDTFGRNVRFRFEQQAARIFLPTSLSDAPLPTSDPPLHAILLKVGRHMLTQNALPTSVASRVRPLLIASLHEGRPGIAPLCRRLAMSERTLRRRLAEEGTSFADLLDQVRASLIRILDSGPELSEKELAAKLGFESTSALRRARKRWREHAPPPLSAL
jgi:AraC-like DNA-binding protein